MQDAATFEPTLAGSRLPSLCFRLSSVTAVIGVGLGIYMGIAEDHLLAPVHVHLNLIGWVSLFLFGLFYKSHPDATDIAALAQVALSSVGYIVMLSGLAGLLLTASPLFFPLAVGGSIMVWLGFAIFAVIVARKA